MAFFKSFQESLSSVSSILDTVSSTVSSTVDGVKTAVSDVTYSVSDQLTEQVNTIINKKQGEDEGEASAEKDSESRAGGGERINSKKHAYADEEEERREREKQEQERRNEEEQWEWCHAPSKGWYRKRRDPNQTDTSAERQENKEEGTGVSGQLSSSNTDVNVEDVKAVRTGKNERGQDDTISKVSTETANCEDTATEQFTNLNNDQRNGHTQEDQAQDGHDQDGHAQNKDKAKSSEPIQNNEDCASEGEAVESSGVEGQLPEDEDKEEGATGSNRSRGSSVLKDQQDEDEAIGPQGQSEVTEVIGDKKDTEHSVNKDRFRRCTLL